MKRSSAAISAALLTAVLAAAVLSSCSVGEAILSYLNASSFPAHLGLTEKSVDLSRKINWDEDRDDDCWDCDHLFYLRGASGGYVFLVLENSRLVIFDEELNGIQQHTHDREYGSLGLYIGSSGEYVIGSYRYQDDPPEFPEFGQFNLPGHGHGFSHGGHAYALAEQDGDLVTFRDDTGEYDRAALQGVDGIRRRFAGLAVTDAAGAPEVVLFFERENDEREIEAVFLDPAEIDAHLSPKPQPDESTVFGFPIVKFPPADRGRYYAAGNGFVGVWNGSLRFVEAFDGRAEAVSSLSGYAAERLPLAFDPEGDRFYVFDPEVKVLSRCRTWW